MLTNGRQVVSLSCCSISDNYENLYVVLRGAKVFTLLPPPASFRMHMTKYPQATYHMVDSQLVPMIDDPYQTVLWSAVDPLGRQWPSPQFESCKQPCSACYKITLPHDSFWGGVDLVRVE